MPICRAAILHFDSGSTRHGARTYLYQHRDGIYVHAERLVYLSLMIVYKHAPSILSPVAKSGASSVSDSLSASVCCHNYILL